MRSGPEDPGERRASTPLTPVSLNYPQQAFDAALSRWKKTRSSRSYVSLRAGRRRV